LNLNKIHIDVGESIADIFVIDLRLYPKDGKSLTLSGARRAIFLDDPPHVLENFHRIHLFDTLFEAESVCEAMRRSFGDNLERIETGVTEEGHGLVMTVQRRPGDGDADSTLVLVDHRRDAGTGEDGRAIPSPLITRKEASEARRNREMRRLVLMERRGRLIGRLVAESTPDGVSLRSCQRAVVALVEAEIPVDSISIEEVKDRIEEIMTGIDAEIVLPADRVIRGAIARTIEKEPDRQAKLVDDIAWSLVWGNRIDFL
jgi:hypothetical protein